LFVLIEAAQLARPVSPEIWRRYLTAVLDGLRRERSAASLTFLMPWEPGRLIPPMAYASACTKR
jgi:hypothetical protein